MEDQATKSWTCQLGAKGDYVDALIRRLLEL